MTFCNGRVLVASAYAFVRRCVECNSTWMGRCLRPQCWFKDHGAFIISMEEDQIRVGVSAFGGFILDVTDLGLDLICGLSNITIVNQGTDYCCGVQLFADPFLRQYVKSSSYNSSFSSAPQSGVLNVFAFEPWRTLMEPVLQRIHMLASAPNPSIAVSRFCVWIPHFVILAEMGCGWLQI